jgi:hypothetical protein
MELLETKQEKFRQLSNEEELPQKEVNNEKKNITNTKRKYNNIKK